MAAKDQAPKTTSKHDHAERAAEALRENLRKRKAQQRERAERAGPAAPQKAAEGEKEERGK